MRVAVLGAGIAGLTVAHALRRDAAARKLPFTLEVFEGSARVGGRIHTTREHGFLVEWGANAFRTGLGPARSLVDDLGLAGERIEASPNASRRYVFSKGALHRLPAGPGSVLGFAPLSLGGRLRVFAEPLVAQRVSREETVLEYASRHIGPEAARVMLGTFVRGVYAGDAGKLSVDAAFPRMRELEKKHRSLVLAMAKERRERKAIWTLRRGMGSLLERAAESLDGAVFLKQPALRLSRLPEFSARIPFTVAFASGESRGYDAVVVALPPLEAAALLRDLDADAAKTVREIPCAGVAMVALGFRAEAFRGKPDGYGFLVAPGEDTPLLGAVFESNLFPERAPEGYVLVRGILGGVARPDIVTLSDAALTGLACQAIDRALGLKAGPERTWVVRQEGAIPQYTMGHRDRIASVMSRLGAYPGLYIAGNAYRGISVGSIVEDAEKVSEWVLHRAV